MRLWPDPLGMQHDEREGLGEAAWQKWLPAKLRITWPAALRTVHPEAELRPSVFERLASQPVVQHDDLQNYLPVQLRDHPLAQKYYADDGGIADDLTGATAARQG